MALKASGFTVMLIKWSGLGTIFKLNTSLSINLFKSQIYYHQYIVIKLFLLNPLCSSDSYYFENTLATRVNVPLKLCNIWQKTKQKKKSYCHDACQSFTRRPTWSSFARPPLSPPLSWPTAASLRCQICCRRDSQRGWCLLPARTLFSNHPGNADDQKGRRQHEKKRFLTNITFPFTPALKLFYTLHNSTKIWKCSHKTTL